MHVTIRPATPTDAPTCGRIIYEAFLSIATRHNFPPDFADVQSGDAAAGMLLRLPDCFGVVAERDGRIIGCNFVSEHDTVRGIGPISVHPSAQGRGAGRRLMEVVLQRCAGAAAIRLVQDAFNDVSMSLYASLGFDVQEPLVLIEGSARGASPAGTEVRPLRAEDLTACHQLCKQIHGIERCGDLEMALGNFTPFVALRDGRITAYVSAAAFWKTNHGVAETLDDMAALLIGAARLTAQPISFLLPTRQGGFFRWALRAGLRVVKPLSLMTIGSYTEPRGCWFPSVLY
jgi:predicted N-acetyltransferase YhbS